MTPVIAIRELSKWYGRTMALQDVTLDVPHGSILGLIGDNGSGKTTLLKICMGLAGPSRGAVTVLGRDPRKERVAICRDVCYIPDMAMLDGWLTVRQLLRYTRGLHPNWNHTKAEALFQRSGLNLDQKIAALSKGMREKLYLLIALSINSQVMLLDEPTLGLDVAFRRVYIEQLLADYATDERTIVIATHQIDEFEAIFDRLVFLDQGRVLLHATTEDVQRDFSIVRLNAAQSGVLPEHAGYQLGELLQHTRYLVRNEQLDAIEALRDIPRATPNLTEIALGVPYLLGTRKPEERRAC